MRFIRFLTAAATFFMPLASIAAADSLRLICAYAFTVDGKGNRSPSTGEALVTVAPTGNGGAMIYKEGLGTAFAGEISDDAIQGQVEYQIQGLIFKENLNINRFTGAFTNTVVIKSSELIFFGTCRAVSEPLF